MEKEINIAMIKDDTLMKRHKRRRFLIPLGKENDINPDERGARSGNDGMSQTLRDINSMTIFS
jgi:predicted transcriptional regulator